MKISISEDILFQLLDTNSVVLDLKSESYFGLDEMGTKMWQLLTEFGNIDAVVKQLGKEYQVDKVSLRQDIDNLVKQLANNSLLTIIDE